MGIPRLVLIFLSACVACVSTDYTSGLPCTKDAQCGGDEHCVGGYCGGSQSIHPPTDTMTMATTPDSSGDVTTEGIDDITTGTALCFAPEPGCPSCDPLIQPCDGDSACYPASDGTAACEELHGDQGLHEECAYPFDSSCEPGLYCDLAIEELCGTDKIFCCWTLCDLDDAASCDSSELCMPLSRTPAIELEHLGRCEAR